MRSLVVGRLCPKIRDAMLGVLCFLFYSSCLADDTDIYLNVGAGMPPGSEPMIMFSLDYRPNLASTACQGDECDQLINEGWMAPNGPYTFFDVLRGALRKVMAPLEGVRVGLMLNHDNFAGVKGSNGGYIAMGFEPFLRGDSNGAKAKFHDILANIPLPRGSQSHSFQGKELYFEFFRYLTGQKIYSGHQGWVDYSTDDTNNLDVDGARYAWDPSIERGDRYESPYATASECVNTFAVNMQFFVANQEDDADAAIADDIALGGLGEPQKDFTEIIAYMQDADLASGVYGTAPTLPRKQNVTSYFLVDSDFINQTSIDYARAGGTGFPLELSDDPDMLVQTLKSVFNEILSVSTTFVSASLPVNAFNRSEVVDNIYLALFQVNEDNKPVWTGNVKKLKLTSNGTSSYLTDALGTPAVSLDGRIRQEALTYWTLPDQLPPPDPNLLEVDKRDGRSVTRGGAGQRVPGYLTNNIGLVNGLGTRRVFYDRSGALRPFNVDSTTANDLLADLGAVDVNDAAYLIAYARGMDVDDLDRDRDVREPRSWIFGDPLHSRPLPLNYGARGGYTVSNPAIYLAVGSNDGFMHFLRNTTAAGAESGTEAWAFFPRTSAPAVKKLRRNAVGEPHPYTVDGSPTAYIDDLNSNGTIDAGERVLLYFGLRRGGKAYYALDVSDPENPRLAWQIDKSGDFSELGMTFSRPRVGRVNLGSGPQPVLVFAGGYDINKDTRGSVGTDDSEGNAIYVVDALTGSLIWKARRGTRSASRTIFEHPDLVDSIPSEVSLLDTNGDGLSDRIVVGDMGGNVWRVDLSSSDTSQWKISRLAALGRHSAAFSGSKADDRRFFHRPDVVLSSDANGPFDAVLIGSGDRADPLDQGGLASNYFYMLKDRQVALGSGIDIAIDHNQLGDVTDNCIQESGCSVDLTHGWRMRMEEGGEKVLSSAVTIAGTVYFTSYIPGGAVTADPCSPAEGTGRLYAVDIQDASSVINYDTATDDPNWPDEGMTKSDRFTDLRSPGIPSEVVPIPSDTGELQFIRSDLQVDDANANTRWRTFWYLEEDSDL